MRAQGEATRARILAAAAEEFTVHGVAGARINRIADTAKASKERLYAYFGTKEELFSEVISANVEQIVEAVPISEDLPDYVGRLFDYLNADPRRQRVLAWAWLEGPGEGLPEGHPRLNAYRDKAATVRRAQEAGRVDPAWDPYELLAMLCSLASAWLMAPHELRTLAVQEAPERGRDHRREAVVEAARRLVRTAPAAPRHGEQDPAVT
ncbi:TetR family transcriptional regulator [Nocardiopsis rhodophaea]|uniref:TetR family transcriptional regulator n=1 Tax=Nocardiopsis rhodophaea TaxID=280238 RepID=A0ABP5ENI7_9ACTN